MESLLNVRQIAYMLKVHPLTIRRYIREGRLKAVRVGGNVRVKESDLQSFHKDLSTAPVQQSIIINAKKNLPKVFSQIDPFLQLSGRGASLDVIS